MNELALFAGAGGGILGGHLLGWRTVCAVERDAYAAQVLAQRQNDGCLPAFPIWSDVCSFDGRPWRGLVDVVSGGFPCQDISAAGNGAGIDGDRSGLWREMARIVGEVRPRFVFVENSPLLVGRGLAVVLGDLAELGYDAQWLRLSASDCGAPHQRDRLWLVANAYGSACKRNTGAFPGAQARMDSKGQLHGGVLERSAAGGSGKRARNGGSWPAEPAVGRVADGVAFGVDRIKALGNGQVPRVAAAAFSMLVEQGGRVNG
ncbi:DNA cytosine methyltransferase [Stutzerimonas degradans]|nr:DNA cytosine methyltransferase [Stutzerimonas degradans]